MNSDEYFELLRLAQLLEGDLARLQAAAHHLVGRIRLLVPDADPADDFELNPEPETEDDV